MQAGGSTPAHRHMATLQAAFGSWLIPQFSVPWCLCCGSQTHVQTPGPWHLILQRETPWGSFKPAAFPRPRHPDPMSSETYRTQTMVPGYMWPNVTCIIPGVGQVRGFKDTRENVPVHRPRCNYPADGCKGTARPRECPPRPTALRAGAKSVPFAS